MNITHSMVQNVSKLMEVNTLEEKTYKLLKRTGAANIAMGVVAVVAGIAVGVITIVNGAKLIKGKKYISF